MCLTVRRMARVYLTVRRMALWSDCEEDGTVVFEENGKNVFDCEEDGTCGLTVRRMALWSDCEEDGKSYQTVMMMACVV